MYVTDLTGLLLVLFAASEVSAQTVYKCVHGGKTTYSSSPCGNAPAKELYLPPPTAEERRQGEAKRDEYRQQWNSSMENRRAYEADMERGSQATATNEAQLPQVDPRANEKIMVHTPSGWDYKTRAQIVAEEQARSTGSSGGGTVVINGVPYPRSGRNGVINPKTGKYCPLVGNTAFCN